MQLAIWFTNARKRLWIPLNEKLHVSSPLAQHECADVDGHSDSDSDSGSGDDTDVGTDSSGIGSSGIGSGSGSDEYPALMAEVAATLFDVRSGSKPLSEVRLQASTVLASISSLSHQLTAQLRELEEQGRALLAASASVKQCYALQQ